jgi:WD40 repeat protein
MLQKPGGSALTCSVFSPDGKSVLTAGDQGLLVLWDPLTGQEIRTFDKGPITSMYVKYFPNGTQVLTASQWGNDPGMHIWDVASGKIVGSFQMEKGGVASFDISPDGKTIVTGDQNSEFSVRLWSLDTRATLWEHSREHLSEEEGLAVWGVAFSESGTLIAAATSGGCFILEAATGKILHRLPGLSSGNGAAFLSGDDYLLCTGLLEDCVAKYDVRSGKRVERTPKIGNGLFGLNLSGDKTRAVVGAFDQSARIIETQNLTNRTTGLGLFDGPALCAVTPDGNRVVTLHSEGGLRWWNAQSGEPVTRLASGPVRLEKPIFMQMSPDGRTLLFYDYAARAFVALDLPSEKTRRIQRLEFDKGWVPRVAWASPPAEASIYCALSNGVSLLNLKSGVLSPVGGADGANPLTSREVVMTRKGALFIQSDRGTSIFTICAAGDSQQRSPFALDNGYELNLCVAAPDGQRLLVAENDRSGETRLASYQIQPEEVVSVETLDGLIAALGSATFREREAAQRKFERMGFAAIPALAQAVQSPDPEIKARARPIFTRLSENYQNGNRPSGTVVLCNSGDRIMELQVSADGRRWVAVFGQSLIMGRVDAGNGSVFVATHALFPGRVIQASVFDDCRRCLTLCADKTLSVWDLNWDAQTVRTNDVAVSESSALINQTRRGPAAPDPAAEESAGRRKTRNDRFGHADAIDGGGGDAASMPGALACGVEAANAALARRTPRHADR